MAAVTVVEPGEREQGEWALVVQLAAEFQGYCRDLHSLAVYEIMDKTATQTPGLEAVIRQALSSRAMATGNAGKHQIGEDFTRIGLGKIWELVVEEEPHAVRWIQGLGNLLAARNAIAHGDHGKIAVMRPRRVTLAARCTGWNTDLNNIVDVMDRIVAIWLQGFLQLPRPW